jgi:hypothetical protein
MFLLLTIILYSFLFKLDSKNFGENMIEQYFENAITFVYNLYEDTLDDVDPPVLTVAPTIPKSAAPLECSAVSDINEQEMELYASVRDRRSTENIVVINRQQIRETQRSDLRAKIKKSMDDYRSYCENMNMEKYLEDNGNDLYKSMVKNKTIELLKIQFDDALYCSKFFDASKWWMKHQTKYPELAMGASIILGKPTHNAFQERVFSRGTYSDTKLRKRLREEYFEMSVINSVNGKQIDEIYHIMQPSIMMKEKERQQEMKLFMEKRKRELDLTNEVTKSIDDDDESEAPDEYGSICSEAKDEVLLDDDEDDDWSILDDMNNITLGKISDENDCDYSSTKLV